MAMTEFQKLTSSAALEKMGSHDDDRGTPLRDTDGEPSGRTVPILSPMLRSSAPSTGDPMDVSSPIMAPMGPPARASPDSEANGLQDHTGLDEHNQAASTTTPNAAVAAHSGGLQPKVVQTAFIHKLYNMLEDQSIRHLISWSNSAESFIMSPSNDFSKALSQYFKHTNISSFVRQLNMYGFHKVSDVFHNPGSPESPMWEFKHGNGNFKRGDLVGLREIKRRASRHALVHRDSYSSIKAPSYQQTVTPTEPAQAAQDPVEMRLTTLEHALYDVHARLAQSEETARVLHVKNQAVLDALSRSLSLNHEMSRAILGVIGPEAPFYRSIFDMQADIHNQSEILRSMEDIADPPYSSSRQYFSNLSLDGAPVSPRQLALDDARRPHTIGAPPRQHAFRPAVPSNLSLPPGRRYGSIGSNASNLSPNSTRYQAPLPPPPPHPLSAVTTPPTNLPRRHTSADIRVPHGWQANPSPFASGNTPAPWPPSPKRGPTYTEDQRIRDSLSSYSLQGTSQNTANHSRSTTPPLPVGNGNPSEGLVSWSWGSSRGDKFGGPNHGGSSLLKDSSAPSTRRGSMAHILNPAETAERDEEHEEELRDEDRKRKRVL